MLTLYGFATIFAEGVGETKDLRAQWALEETGLAYRVHGVDHTAGEHNGEAYSRISPFHQVPVLDDDGFVVAESAAIVLYVAEKAGTLIPRDFQGRTRVTQWCFAAVSTIAPSIDCLDMLAIFDGTDATQKVKAGVTGVLQRFLGDLDRRLKGRDWVASDEFSAADIMMAGVLRVARKSDLYEPFPRVKAYYARCFARPAWERTLSLYAERLGARVEDIR